MSGSHWSLPAATSIGRVALRVNDIERVSEFYATVVGLEILDRTADRVTLGAGGTALLELLSDPDAPERERTAAGLFHTAFLVPSRAALADALERVETHDELSGASDHHVSEALYLRDPEDNGIEIYRDRPREEWEEADDGTVTIVTLPLEFEAVRELGSGATEIPAGTTVGHVHIEATSLPAAREFYVDTLGMAVRQTVPSALFVAAGGYHHHLGVNAWNHRTTPASGRGMVWFELRLPDRETLTTVRHRLDERGFSTTVMEDGIAVDDPDGIELRLRVAGST